MTLPSPSPVGTPAVASLPASLPPPAARATGGGGETLDGAKVEQIESLASDHSEAATSALLHAAESASLLISTAAIRGLADRGCERVEPVLVGLLGDDQWERRAWAAKVLGENGCGGARAAIAYRLQSEGDARVQARLQETMQRLGQVGR